MAASLIVRTTKRVPFPSVMESASTLLLQLLKTDSVPDLTSELPPAKRSSSLEDRIIDGTFPGAYVRFRDIEGSLVDYHAFDSPTRPYEERLLVSCEASGRGPASDVLAAALAIASARLANGLIDDAGHHWIEKDEYGPEELLAWLRLSEKRASFQDAIEAVYKKEAIHKRRPPRPRNA